jgi:hypothetical protein
VKFSSLLLQHVYSTYVLLGLFYEQGEDCTYLSAFINCSIARPKAVPIFEKVIALPR